MEIRWTESSAKHDIPRDDVVHAMLKARWQVRSFEPSRVPGLADPDLYIGPTRAGGLIEIMASVDPAAEVLWVFHVMPARPKIIAKAKEATK